MHTKQTSDVKRSSDLYARTFVPLGVPELPGAAFCRGGLIPGPQLTCSAGSLLLAGVPVLVAESSADDDTLDEDLHAMTVFDNDDDIDDFDDMDDEDDELDDLDDMDDEDWEDDFEDEDEDEDEFEDEDDDDDDFEDDDDEF